MHLNRHINDCFGSWCQLPVKGVNDPEQCYPATSHVVQPLTLAHSSARPHQIVGQTV